MMVGELDGDGQLDLVVRLKGRAPDVINPGYTPPVIFQGYSLTLGEDGMEGTILWEVDVGINVRAGQHYLQPMLYNFDGGLTAQLMLKSAPGTRWRTFEDGVYRDFDDDTWTYITMPEDTTQTRWDGTNNWTHQDDFRSNDWTTTGATREDGLIFQWLVEFFYNWQRNPEVTNAFYGPNLEYDHRMNRSYTCTCDDEPVEVSGFGWWMFPPQVMMGMHPAGYVGATGPVVAAGNANTFVPLAAAPGWTLERWELLNAIPKCPVEFRDHEITREEALALAHLLYRSQTINVQRITSGHIICGPEFFSVFDGLTGRELDTIEYLVPRGFIHPVTGEYTPDIGIFWLDFAYATIEPLNRVERFRGATAYLDGPYGNASAIQGRGYYGSSAIMRYDWDGENLTGEVLNWTGHAVSLNPFHTGSNNNGGSIAVGAIHASPGRGEGPLTFDPTNPRFQITRVGDDGVTYFPGPILTEQGGRVITIMDVDRDGYDEIISGGFTLNSDGSLRHATYYWNWGATATTTVPGTPGSGAWSRMGHGNDTHAGYFHPSQEYPALWNNGIGRATHNLQNLDTGEIMFSAWRGSATGANWGGTIGQGFRGIVGKFTTEPGWQLFGNGGPSTPAGSATLENVNGLLIGLRPDDHTSGGLRQWDGSGSRYVFTHTGPLSVANPSPGPGTNWSIQFRPDLTRQTISGSANAMGDTQVQHQRAAGSNPGNRIQAFCAEEVRFIDIVNTSDTLATGGTKGQVLTVDMYGDYREEMIVGTTNAAGSNVRIYFNTEESEYKLATLMTDRRYRVEITRQHSAYGRPAYTGFYLGTDMWMDVYFDSIGAKLPTTEFSWPEPADIVDYNLFLPDPFQFAGQDGRMVRDRHDWFNNRVPEIKDLAQFYQYGFMPDPANETVTAVWTNEARTTMAVTVTRNDVEPPRSVTFNQTIVFPNAATQEAIPGPYPVVIGMSALGNAVAIQNAGFATINNIGTGTFSANNMGRAGLFGQLYPNEYYDWGVYIAWSWGVSRIIDALEYLAAQGDGDDRFDPDKIALSGFSQWGKATLVAGLLDTRIGVINPAGSGTAGAGVYRIAFDRVPYPWGYEGTAEMLRDAQQRFPQWFNSRMNQFTRDYSDAKFLPFDQHELIAAIAPRGVFSSVGIADFWLNAEGMYVAYHEAAAVFEWLGVRNNIGFLSYSLGHANIPASHAHYFISFLNHMFRGEEHALEAPIEVMPTPGPWLGATAPVWWNGDWTMAELEAMPNWRPHPSWATSRPLGSPDEVVGLRSSLYLVDVTGHVDTINELTVDTFTDLFAIPVTAKAINNADRPIRADLYINGSLSQTIDVTLPRPNAPNATGTFAPIRINDDYVYQITVYFAGDPRLPGVALTVEPEVVTFNPDWFKARIGQRFNTQAQTGEPTTVHGPGLFVIEFSCCPNSWDAHQRNWTRIQHVDDYTVTINGINARARVRDQDAPWKCCLTLTPDTPLEVQIGDPLTITFNGLTFPEFFPGHVFNLSYTATNQRVPQHNPAGALFNIQFINRWDRWNIDYNLDGGTLPPEARTTFMRFELEELEEELILPIPTRADYEFLGWFTVAEPGEDDLPLIAVPSEQRANLVLYARWSEPPPPIDRDELRSVLEAAAILTRPDFTAANWRLFNPALNHAQDVYANPNSTQAEIDHAANTLRNLVNRANID
jgi:endo-1,4-beta-xylanase